MSGSSKQPVVRKAVTRVDSAIEQRDARLQRRIRWLPAPKKRPVLLALLAVLYAVWLGVLGWIAVSAI